MSASDDADLSSRPGYPEHSGDAIVGEEKV